MSASPFAPAPEGRGRDRLAGFLFIFAVLVYTATRVINIEAFPIYFFCDEAMLVVQFRQMMENGWRAIDAPHELLPAFFKNAAVYNLSLSVYFQGLASLVAGEGVAIVRLTFALLSLSGAIALALTAKHVFHVREWWSTVAWLAVIPCWFLHSRTGFESSLMVSCYSWFIYFYLRYRADGARWIIPAMISGAATFYAYAPAQGVMLATGVFLLVSDVSYHWKKRVWVAAALVLGAVLAFPYVRFRVHHPEMLQQHLTDLQSYAFQSISFTEKLKIFAHNYFSGFSLRFWFFKDTDEMVRHVVPGHAHVDFWLIPFVIVGAAVCIFHLRNARHRVLLIAVMACPVSAALVAPTVPRLLTMVVPLALLATLGIDWFFNHVRSARLLTFLRISLASTLALLGGVLTWEALAIGPTLNRDYGLYGMQWGAQAVFRETIPRYLKSDRAANIVITHMSWNWPVVFPEFFGWFDDRRVVFAPFDRIEDGNVLPESKDIVVVSSFEFKLMQQRPEVSRFAIREVISLPDGTPGFYVGHLHLDPEFKAAARARKDRDIQPRWDRLIINGVPCAISSSDEVTGRASALWQGGPGEMEGPRGAPVNVKMFFDQPVKLGPLSIEFVGEGADFTLWASLAGRTVYTESMRAGRWMREPADTNVEVDSLRLEIGFLPDRATRVKGLRFSDKQ